MSTPTVADEIVRRLLEWGVDRIFGYPGDGINGLVGALADAEWPRFTQARHEEMCALEAVGYAKFGGGVGVCLATSGPGAIHLLNGLYDAKLDHVPVVAIVGQAPRIALGGSTMQEVDLASLFKDVCSEYVIQASVPQQFPMVIDRAMRTAMATRSPTCVIVPADLQEEEYPGVGQALKSVPGSLGWLPPEVVAHDDDLRRVAAILNEGERVAILVGQGAREAAAEVLAVADLLGAGISKALLGKDVLPDEHPLVCGSIGLLGTKPSWDLMQGCDTLLMIGSSFPYTQFLPRYGDARGVQIDSSPHNIGLRYPMEANVVGDAGATLRRLIPLLERKTDRSWQDEVRDGIRRWWEVLEAQAMVEADPVNPQRVVWELNPHLPDDAMIAADAGSIANWYARDLKIRDGMRCSLSGTLATMGAGVPYAIGAKFAHPDRPALALMGDGAMQMNGMAELLTVAKYWREWANPCFVCLVLNNGDLNEVTWELRAMGGHPRFEASQALPPFDYARFAESIGFLGIRVESPDALSAAWADALSAGRPAVIDVVTDPDVPPIPPHVTIDQAKKLLHAIWKGDPDGADILRAGFKAKVQELIHR
jgi:pyruvate dehydrogenase (quinone)